MSEYVKIKKGVQVVDSVGPIALAVDRVTRQRALVIDTGTAAGAFPVNLDDEQWLALGIALIRDSGRKICFSEEMQDEDVKEDANAQEIRPDNKPDPASEEPDAVLPPEAR
jgi:hypothetical protein